MDAARARVERALASVERSRSALQLLGLAPDYTCGEAQRGFVSRVVEGLHAEAACLDVQTLSASPTLDSISVHFADGGCEVRGHRLEGALLFTLRQGTDRFELEGDFGRLKVDGTALDARAGYDTCGDGTRYWGEVRAEVADSEGYFYDVNASVAQRDGLPLIGGNRLVLDGDAQLEGPPGTDRITFEGLDYEVGNLLPREGSLEVHPQDGHRVKATFRTTLWRLGEAELEIDDRESVRVPLLR